jgi:hypothetical protein
VIGDNDRRQPTAVKSIEQRAWSKGHGAEGKPELDREGEGGLNQCGMPNSECGMLRKRESIVSINREEHRA